MKASELIKRLQELIEEHGDLEVEKDFSNEPMAGDEIIHSVVFINGDKKWHPYKGKRFTLSHD